CSCADMTDKECLYFCHQDVIW
uniref:Bibrotoxin n=1 Tax=Atractaspis bibronii TaxID=61304 RepID=SRTXB_ATRBI|nr:RecName: Full=Bibrotoxin; Short=BTX [Atractaspis bibronii]AAB24652.1 bibrotoxin, BTX=endothelin/sarafotoxin homolog [Atractaspis bibroni=burrowing asps, venom, Peptide, 21 aa] [Atractaspis bibronii]